MRWAGTAREAADVQWDGRARGRLEAHEVSLQDPSNDLGWWFRYTIDVPVEGEPTCSLWGACYRAREPGASFGLRTAFPITSFTNESDGFHIRVSRGELMLQNATGGLRNPKQDGHMLRWNLTLTEAERPLALMPKTSAYGRSRTPFKVVAPVSHARASGVVEVDGHRHVVKAAHAHQRHSWGERYPDAWSAGVAAGFREDPEATVHAMAFVPPGSSREDLVLHVADGDGRRWALGARRRSAASAQEPGVWTFKARRGRWSASGRFSASLQKMLGFTYDDPLGTQRACHHSGVADATVELWRHGLGRKRLEHTLTARSSCSLEQGALRGFDSVRFFV